MRDIFFAEELERCQHGVRGRLAQAAEGILLDVVSKLFELINILKRTLAGGDLFENLHHALGADPAGGALAAGFVDREF